jgi:activator of HSP90 ATPase
MTYAFELSCSLPATPKDVYDAWLNTARHSAMTGGAAKASKRKGAAHSAWDGYITGRNLELVSSEKIVQTWRTSQFPEAHPDSTIEVTLKPTPEGTRLTLSHSGVPDGQTSYEPDGWQEHYFEPMRRYFDARAMVAERTRASVKSGA